MLVIIEDELQIILYIITDYEFIAINLNSLSTGKSSFLRRQKYITQTFTITIFTLLYLKHGRNLFVVFKSTLQHFVTSMCCYKLNEY